MKEIGSFIGLDLNSNGEYYKENCDVARLNSARAGIYHACKLYNCEVLYLPYYLCPTVKQFLQKKGIIVKYYYITRNFEPVLFQQEINTAVLLVNYFGMLSTSKMVELSNSYTNVIVDNSAAFFSEPLFGVYSVYSPRKFFGVPDGCYVVGKDALRFTEDYEIDYSSETAIYLFKSIEYGTSASYKERMRNEERIDKSDILSMSKLTRSLLKNIDYEGIRIKRLENFSSAQFIFNKINSLKIENCTEDFCIPMFYPLIIENFDLDILLRRNNIYVGRLWKSVLMDVLDNTFEAYLSKYLIPVPIDQRYGREEMSMIFKTIINEIG